MKVKLVIITISLSLIWSSLIMYVFIDTVKESPVKLYLAKSNFVKFYFPQGWGFFTKSPRSSSITVYKKEDSKWIKLQKPNSSPEYYFGFDKTSRAIGIEYGRILNKINSPMWKNFKGFEECFKIADTIKAINYLSDEKYPLLKQEFILVATKPIPWAWRNSFNKNNLEGSIIKIKSE